MKLIAPWLPVLPDTHAEYPRQPRDREAGPVAIAFEHPAEGRHHFVEPSVGSGRPQRPLLGTLAQARGLYWSTNVPAVMVTGAPVGERQKKFTVPGERPDMNAYEKDSGSAPGRKVTDRGFIERSTKLLPISNTILNWTGAPLTVTLKVAARPLRA